MPKNVGYRAGDLFYRRAWNAIEDFRAEFSASEANQDRGRLFESFPTFPILNRPRIDPFNLFFTASVERSKKSVDRPTPWEGDVGRSM